MAPSDNQPFYPYVGTDLEYYEGGIYFVAGSFATTSLGNFQRIDAATGATKLLVKLSASGYESGITIRDGVLYATDGTGAANSLRTVHLQSLDRGTLATKLPATSSSLEYNPVKDRYYFTDVSGSRIMQVAPTGAVTALATGTNGAYNLAVEPSGAALYVIDGTVVRRFDTKDGRATTFLTGLTGANGDLVFGPSSRGSTVSTSATATASWRSRALLRRS